MRTVNDGSIFGGQSTTNSRSNVTILAAAVILTMLLAKMTYAVPVISNVTISPSYPSATLPYSGLATITATANVTDTSSTISIVTAELYHNGVFVSKEYSPVSGGSYSWSFTIYLGLTNISTNGYDTVPYFGFGSDVVPVQGLGAGPVSFNVVITAVDSAGLTASAISGSSVRPADAGPSLGTPQFSEFLGGYLKVTATPTSIAGIPSYGNPFPLYISFPGDFPASVPVTDNAGVATAFEISASGAIEYSGPTITADYTSAVSAAGGSIWVNSSVEEANYPENTELQLLYTGLNLYRDGAYYSGSDKAQSLSGNTFSIPANTSGRVHSWTVSIWSIDNALDDFNFSRSSSSQLSSYGNDTAYTTLGPISQPSDPGPSIKASITPSSLSFTGGTLAVSSSVNASDGATISSVTYQIYKNGVAGATESSPTSSGSTVIGTAAFVIPASTVSAEQVYTVVVRATDSLGVTRSVTVGPVVQAGNVPDISSINPASGPVGTTISVSGKYFTGAAGVSIGSTSGVYTVNSDTNITATIPKGAKSGKINVENANGASSSASTFTVTN